MNWEPSNDAPDFDDRRAHAGYYGTGAPRKNSRHPVLWTLLLLFCVLALALFWFLQRYTLSLERDSEGYHLSIGAKDAAQQSLPESVTAQADTAAEGSQQLLQAAPEGGDTELVICTPQQDTQTQAEALTLPAIYQKLIPSVVSILTTTSSGSASGTGIIMTQDGYIITNNHVVDSAVAIDVLLQSEESYPASLIGADAVSDLAVLKIAADGLTPAEFGDSDAVAVGDSVVAIGDPLGIELRGTMTDGIISAINRNITTNGRTMTLLQTNAQLNSGNSGGPLINCYGQVIGVNTMKFGSYYANSVDGIGFAIPIATAKPIIDELIAQGYVSGRPALGIQGGSVPAFAQIYYKMPNGVYVEAVSESSDAYAKGLRAGDIITKIDGTEIDSIDALNVLKNQHAAGDSVLLTVYRKGACLELSVTLIDQNDAD